ncbi:hypothetical protein [Helicobacter sp. 12S02634-8]|uniref:hypothetical protein n=1 Tax=Helicobacter sp. 12S02634-8 TaxID=1476199 RepID=UPI001554449F|nr:hypothetical protein [Helicobacter sp. 12S02634-8]
MDTLKKYPAILFKSIKVNARTQSAHLAHCTHAMSALQIHNKHINNGIILNIS